MVCEIDLPDVRNSHAYVRTLVNDVEIVGYREYQQANGQVSMLPFNYGERNFCRSILSSTNFMSDFFFSSCWV